MSSQSITVSRTHKVGKAGETFPYGDGSSSKAVALSHEEGQGAQVIARGEGELAEQIRNKAERAGVYVHQDAQLANMLSAVELGESIPQEMYQIIAELIAFARRLDGDSEEAENIHRRLLEKEQDC